MPDSRISDLDTLTSPDDADLLAIVDTSASKTMHISLSGLEGALYQDGDEDIIINSGEFTDAKFVNDIQVNGTGNAISTLHNLINGNTTNINNLANDYVTLNTKQDITNVKVFDSGVGFNSHIKIGSSLESSSYGSNSNAAVEISTNVGGTSLYASHDIVAFSDISVKENIAPITNPINKIKRLNGRVYTRNDLEDQEKLHIGLIAQEVNEVLPEVVAKLSNGKMGVAYQNLVALLIEGMKQQQKQIEKLQSEIKELK